MLTSFDTRWNDNLSNIAPGEPPVPYRAEALMKLDLAQLAKGEKNSDRDIWNLPHQTNQILTAGALFKPFLIIRCDEYIGVVVESVRTEVCHRGRKHDVADIAIPETACFNRLEAFVKLNVFESRI